MLLVLIWYLPHLVNEDRACTDSTSHIREKATLPSLEVILAYFLLETWCSTTWNNKGLYLRKNLLVFSYGNRCSLTIMRIYTQPFIQRGISMNQKRLVPTMSSVRSLLLYHVLHLEGTYSSRLPGHWISISSRPALQEVHGTGSSCTQGTPLNHRSFNTSATTPRSLTIDSMNRYAPAPPFWITLMHSVS